MKYNLRLMKDEDIETIVAGEQKAFGHSLGYDLIKSDFALNPFATYIVLEIDKKVSGYIGVWLKDNGEIINFYVDEEYQQLGFGTLMLNFVIEVCKSSNIKYLSLEVRPSNSKALKLYDKFDFKHQATRKNYYSDGEDAWLLVKEIEVSE